MPQCHLILEMKSGFQQIGVMLGMDGAIRLPNFCSFCSTSAKHAQHSSFLEWVLGAQFILRMSARTYGAQFILRMRSVLMWFILRMSAGCELQAVDQSRTCVLHHHDALVITGRDPPNCRYIRYCPISDTELSQSAFDFILRMNVYPLHAF